MRLFILFFYFVFLALAGAEVYAQIPPPPPPPPPEEAEILCYETIEAWERDPSMREYLSTHNCDCSDGATRPPVCTPVPTPEPKPPVQPAVTPPPVVSQPTQPAVIPPKPTSPPASAPVSGGRPRGNETPANPPVVAPAAPRPTSYPFKGQTLNTAQDLEEVKKRIEELTHEIAGMKVALNGFSRTLLNNNSEFEKWAQTADEAAASATKNLKSFGMDLFLEYCLFAKVEKGVQQAIWKDLDEIINTTNPELKRFLGGILMSRHAEIEGARKITDHIKMSGDLAGIFAEEEKLTQSLDALLFINDVFEAYGFSKVAFQKTPAGKYFAQAKVTGEAIADFSASIYSWYKIDRLSKENEEIARKIEALSSRVDAVLTEMSCLKVCLRDYFENCQATCTRTPKFPVPPPPIR